MRLTTELATDLMITAFEGGSNYWIQEIDYMMVDGRDWTRYRTPLLYGEPQFYEDGNGIKITMVEEDGFGFVDLKKLHSAVDRLPHFHRRMLERGCWDAETADVLLQTAIFGEVIYG